MRTWRGLIATGAGALVLTGSAQGAVLVGTQQVLGAADYNPAGVAEAFRTTAGASGSVVTLSVYVDTGSTATSLVAGLYADGPGRPGALLAQGTLASPTAAAWNTVTLGNSATVTAGAAYWIAILGPSGTLRYRDACCGGGTPAQLHTVKTLTTLPAAWTTGSVFADGPLSAYASSLDGPVLAVAPAGLSFAALEGGPPPTGQNLTITNGGSGLLDWSAGSSAGWINVVPAGGVGNGSTFVSASTSGLAAGTYSGTVTVSAAGAGGSPVVVPVTLTITRPDTSAPTVSVTAPAAGAVLSGSTTVVAAAGDDIGVAGVQFRLDGQPLGAEDTAPPYELAWDTRQAANGPHALSAVARDAAGRTTTSTDVVVSVENTAPAPPSGLVAAYGFDEASGATVTDASGRGNAGTISGATRSTAGRYGSALSFDGVNDIVTVPDADSLDLRTALTVEAWVFPTNLGNRWRTVVAKEAPGALRYDLYANTNTRRPSAEVTTGATYETRGTAQLPLNAWSHLAATWDGSTIRLYVGGALVSSQTAPGTIATSTGALRIGGNSMWSEWFAGRIDDVRIYARSLSAAEVQADMSTPVGPPVPDTQAPSVAVSAPSAGATVAGSTTVSASANDNVGVVGVQFKLNGANLGLEDTAAPYAVAWDTLTAANGPNSLSAVARDAAGNMTTSALVPVTVANPPPDTTAPTVALTAPAAGATVSGTTSVAASASDDVAVQSVQFLLDGQNLGAPDTVSPYAVDWNTTGAANGLHTLAAAARDAAGNVTTTAATSVTVANGGGAQSVGAWSAPVGWPLVAVHMSLLPNGRVLMFDGFDAATNSERIWNPATDTFTAIPYGRNLFCAGHVLLADGRTLIAGGHIGVNEGLRDTTLFDATTNTWTRAADMAVGRWYPTATVLADGRVLVLAGDGIVAGRPNQPPALTSPSVNSLPEVFDPVAGTWTALTGARITSPLYPYLFLLSDGRVLDAGPDTTTRILSPIGWTWSTLGTSPFDGGSAVMYRPNKVMKSGSWADVDFKGVLAYRTHGRTAVLDMNAATPAWRETAPMKNGRGYHNLTLLPDGTVFASGGGSNSDGVDLANSVLPTEIWNPDTETWTETAPLRTGRLYHSTAMLLPDGRVLMAGGGQLPNSTAVDQRNAEIYSPPYLFKGPRPSIASAPATLQYGQPFDVVTPDASRIASVSLVRTPSVTHGFDQNQRFQFLSFTQQSGSLRVEAPPANLTPPGYYMLFVVDTSGVPSVASFVRFPAPWEDNIAPGPPGALTAAGMRAGASLGWTAASDNVGVARYNVYRSPTPSFTPSTANRIGQTSQAAYVDSGLAAGTYYYRVRAEDAAGNLGPSSNEAVAVATGDDVSPTVSVTAPAAGATISGTVTVTAAATDDVGVASVQFRLDGADLGPPDAAPPYTTAWNTAAAANGPHTLAAIARDAAGNATTAAPVGVVVDNAAPPPLRILVGDSAVRASVDYNPAGTAGAFQYTASATGTVTQLSFYVDASSLATSLRAGLYTDAGGRPGTLLGEGTLAAPVRSSWNIVPLPGAFVTAGTAYWIAFLGPAGSGTLRFRVAEGGGRAQVSAQTTLVALPATWTSGTTYFDGPASAYVSGT